MLLQYQKINENDSFRFLLLFASFIEVILIVAEFIAYSIAALTISRQPFHFNLKLILGYAVIAYCIDIIARLLIISFETNLLHIEDSTVIQHTLQSLFKVSDRMFILLVLCSFYRTFFMVLVCSISLLLATERYFATIWVTSYEIKKHKQLSVVLVNGNVLAGIIGTLIFHFELFNLILLTALGLSVNLISLIAYVTLYNLNDNNMKMCQTRSIHKFYTLSMRFQLNENLKVMKWLKNSILVMAVFNVSLASFLVGANDNYMRTNYPELAKYSHTFLNLGIAIYGQSVVFVALLADRNFRKIFLRFKLVRKLTKPFFGRIFPKDYAENVNLTTSEETNVYFTSLSSQWNTQMMEVEMVKNKKNLFLRNK